MQIKIIDYRAATEGSKYVELGRQPHEFLGLPQAASYCIRFEVPSYGFMLRLYIYIYIYI